MDTPKPPQKPVHLLDDLESIRQLLGDENLQPPLLTDTVAITPATAHDEQIPLLFEPINGQEPQPAPRPETKPETKGPDALLHLDSELRAAAQLIMQDVIDDFAPHIETEIKRRLDARMERLLAAATSGKL
ncbi:DNA polymerase III subunit chi [Pseudomonas citri]|uniref:DNA polymerase III subunit chi n=1 Tax=Pseudomonas citri TaxID=2978349 RepID=UPI0021B50FF8|nr:DNA polymerase III subunit chi [Pseudomonas citri]